MDRCIQAIVQRILSTTRDEQGTMFGSEQLHMLK